MVHIQSTYFQFSTLIHMDALDRITSIRQHYVYEATAVNNVYTGT